MRYGFIGCGNMGGAIAKALAKSNAEIMIADPSPAAETLAQTLNAAYVKNEQVISDCGSVFLAVKPQMMEKVLSPLAADIRKYKPLIITIAAGIEIERITQMIGGQVPIIRIMPNTPVAVGWGMIVYCTNSLVTEQMRGAFLDDMKHAGRLDPIDEKLIDAASALSGSGPAYMYMLVEALADGAVACGLPRAKAIEYASATMLGAAQMLLSTGQHPGKLKDDVCSPGGSTIAGVRVLEEKGFRSAAQECVCAAYEKNKKLC